MCNLGECIRIISNEIDNTVEFYFGISKHRHVLSISTHSILMDYWRRGGDEEEDWYELNNKWTDIEVEESRIIKVLFNTSF